MESIKGKCGSFRNWLLDISCFTRVVVILMAFFYVLLKVIGEKVGIEKGSLEVDVLWKTFVYEFQNRSLFGVFFQIAVYLPVGSLTEKKLGTARYLFFFTANCGIIAAGSVIVVWVIGAVFQRYEAIYGLWGMIMLEIVMRYHGNRGGFFLCNSVYEISSNYAPLLFFPFLAYFGCWVTTFIGLGLGYLRNSYTDSYNFLRFTYLSDLIAQQIDESAIYRILHHIPVYILSSDIEVIELKVPYEHPIETLDEIMNFN